MGCNVAFGFMGAAHPVIYLRATSSTCLLLVTLHKYGAGPNNQVNPMRASNGRTVYVSRLFIEMTETPCCAEDELVLYCQNESQSTQVLVYF